MKTKAGGNLEDVWLSVWKDRRANYKRKKHRNRLENKACKNRKKRDL